MLKNELLEARKKAFFESLQPFLPPSKTLGAYCTQLGEQCVCGGRHITWGFSSGRQSYLAEKSQNPNPSPQKSNYSSTPNVLHRFKQKLPLWSSQKFLAFALSLMLLGLLHRLKQVVKTLTAGYSTVICNFLKLVTLPWATQSSYA